MRELEQRQSALLVIGLERLTTVRILDIASTLSIGTDETL